MNGSNQETPKRRLWPWILAAVVAGVLLLAALPAALVLTSVFSYWIAQEAAESQYTEATSIAGAEPPSDLKLFKFQDDFRVSTADRDEAHFIKIRMSLGYQADNGKLEAELDSRREQFRNIVNLILMQKRKQDVDSVAEQIQLREEIKASLNHILGASEITEVYFSEFLVN